MIKTANEQTVAVLVHGDGAVHKGLAGCALVNHRLKLDHGLIQTRWDEFPVQV